MNNKKIIVAYDGSAGSEKALKFAMDLAKTFAAEILLVSVIDMSTLDLSPLVYSEGFDIPKLEHAIKLNGERIVISGKKHCEDFGVKANTMVLIGNPSDEIIKFAHKENVYLIVIGSRGRGGFEQLMLGSVAQAVVTHSDIPVLVVK